MEGRDVRGVRKGTEREKERGKWVEQDSGRGLLRKIARDREEKWKMD